MKKFIMKIRGNNRNPFIVTFWHETL